MNLMPLQKLQLSSSADIIMSNTKPITFLLCRPICMDQMIILILKRRMFFHPCYENFIWQHGCFQRWYVSTTGGGNTRSRKTREHDETAAGNFSMGLKRSQGDLCQKFFNLLIIDLSLHKFDLFSVIDIFKVCQLLTKKLCIKKMFEQRFRMIWNFL